VRYTARSCADSHAADANKRAKPRSFIIACVSGFLPMAVRSSMNACVRYRTDYPEIAGGKSAFQLILNHQGFGTHFAHQRTDVFVYATPKPSKTQF
jgi:hypothetical protein